MSRPILHINGLDDLAAAVPHMIGFVPHESVVVVPTTPGLPACRFNLPRTEEDRVGVLEAMLPIYAREAAPGARVALVSYTEDGHNADLASVQMAAGLDYVGVGTDVRLWATETQWLDLDSGNTGARSRESVTRLEAEAVMAGRPAPAASRQALSDELVGDREPVARELPAAYAAAEASTPVRERNWAVTRLQQFKDNGNRLTDPDAARLLVAVSAKTVRDTLLVDMSRENASTHAALWRDLTQRAPDETRTPAASLLAFANWLKGDGARAWSALRQIPQDHPPYALASLVATALEDAVTPAAWDQMRATSASRSYDPAAHDTGSRNRAEDRGIPSSDPPDHGRDRPAR